MTGRRLLLTGATGFLGSWTLRHWQEVHPDVELWATSDRPDPPSQLPPERYRQLDLMDSEAVHQLVDEVRPTDVIHLASLIANAALADFLAVNVVGTDHLYTALADADLSPKPRVVQAGSAAIYGVVRDEELPIREDQPLRPLSPYALSKACQDQLAAAVWKSRRLPVIRARIFNMLGPGQPDALVPMAFIKQLRQCQAGRSDRLRVGNTIPRRDFVDVRDVVEGFDLILEKASPGEAYNLASGRDVAISDIIDSLLQISGVRVPVETANDRRRDTDVLCVRADVSKIGSTVGWTPKITLRQSLEDMWSHGPVFVT